MNKENKILDKYILQLEYLLKNIPISLKYEILMDVRNFIASSQEKSKIKTSDIIESLGDKENVLNHYMIQHGLKPIKKKKSYFFKSFIAFFLMMILSGVILLSVFIKSLLPLMSIDSEKGKLRFLGDRITLDMNQDMMNASGSGVIRYQSHTQTQRSMSSYRLLGDVPLGADLKKVLLEGKNIDITISSHDEKKFYYDCLSNVQTKDRFYTNKGTFHFSLKHFTKCKLVVSNHIPFDLKVLNGKIKLKNLGQNFHASLKNGEIHWDENQKDKFYLNHKIHQGNIVGDHKSFQKKSLATYEAKLNVLSGLIHIE